MFSPLLPAARISLEAKTSSPAPLGRFKNPEEDLQICLEPGQPLKKPTNCDGGQKNLIQAPAEGQGLGIQSWKKEVVCIMHACDRWGKIPVVCLSVG